MGPRPLGRGDKGSHREPARSNLGFNGAATSRPRRQTPPATWQGRGRSSFNGAATSRPRRPQAASPAADEVSGFNGAATSRPRRPRDPRRSPGASEPLQWGRDLSAAETNSNMSPLNAAISRMLQWGRDLSAAETSSPVTVQGGGCGPRSGVAAWLHDQSPTEHRAGSWRLRAQRQ